MSFEEEAYLDLIAENYFLKEDTEKKLKKINNNNLYFACCRLMNNNEDLKGNLELIDSILNTVYDHQKMSERQREILCDFMLSNMWSLDGVL